MIDQVAKQIRDLYPTVTFDCRDLLSPDNQPDYSDHMTDRFRDTYMAFKYAVAKVLQPKSICEIGVCAGIGALAFLAASPDAQYLGIDNEHEDRHRGVEIVGRTERLLASRGYNSRIMRADSQELAHLPGEFDLIHIDGCHLQKCARHDFLLAWNALLPGGHILVDDSLDAQVATGVFSAISYLGLVRIAWVHFENTWTGSILISKE